MSLYTDIVAGVNAWTNRPLMTAEIDIGIRQALRAAHRAGKFPRDLVEVVATGLSTTTVPQVVDLAVVAPLCRQIAQVKPTGVNLAYKEVLIGDLFDLDGFYRTDVFYGLGTQLLIRPGAAYSSATITYYKHPVVSPIASIDSWIGTDHQDLIVCWAAASVLAAMGEQEIKARVEALAGILLQQLVADSLQLAGA